MPGLTLPWLHLDDIEAIAIEIQEQAVPVG